MAITFDPGIIILIVGGFVLLSALYFFEKDVLAVGILIASIGVIIMSCGVYSSGGIVTIMLPL